MTMRTYLGKARSFGSNIRVFQIEEGFELEVHEQFDVQQRLVLFDEVMLVTLHREYGWVYLLITGIWSAFYLAIGAIFLATAAPNMWPMAIGFAAVGAPALVAFLFRLIVGLHVVTIFGKRSKAVLRFTWGKKRARGVYERICAAVANARPQQTVQQSETSISQERDHDLDP